MVKFSEPAILQGEMKSYFIYFLYSHSIIFSSSPFPPSPEDLMSAQTPMLTDLFWSSTVTLGGVHQPCAFTLVLLAMICCAFAIFILFFKRAPFSWEKHGIIHAKARWIPTTDFRAYLKELIAHFGDKVGLSSSNGTLVTTDLDLIKNILVKDFSNFTNRSGNVISNSVLMKSLFFSKNETWKMKRRLLTPNFSAARMKLISKVIDQKATSLRNHLAKYADSGHLVPVKQLCSHFIGEVMAQSAFGCQIDCLGNGESDEFTFYCNNVLKKRGIFYRCFIGLINKCRRLHVFLVKCLGLSFFDLVNYKTADYFTSMLKHVLEQRLESMKKGIPVPMDYLQMLINMSSLARIHDEAKSSKLGIDVARHKADDKSNNQMSLTVNDIIAEMMLVIFAGFETTVTTLHFVLYYLGSHPEIQEKVLNEINYTFTEQTNLDASDKLRSASTVLELDQLSKLTYTKQAIDETLRLFPPVPVINRIAEHDYAFNGITIPARAKVTIPIFLINRNPHIYPDPDKFDPDRFSTKQPSQRHPSAFLPFGMGSRRCIGTVMAYNQIKIALVRVLKTMKVVVNEETVPMIGQSLQMGLGVVPDPLTPIKVMVKLRQL